MINDLPEVIGNLLRQETTFYKCEDYLSPEFQRERQDELLKRDQGNFLISDRPDSCDWATSSSTSSGDVSESWREKICEWSYQVIDHFDFEREGYKMFSNCQYFYLIQQDYPNIKYSS